VEIMVHVDRRAGSGAGPAVRVTILTPRMAAWFPRQRTLRQSASQIVQAGKVFARDLKGELAKMLGGGRQLGRQELRRKAPGKMLDLIERIEPAHMLRVETMGDLAARERDWLGDEIANLRRAVHSDSHFARLMMRLKKETAVGFLPTTTAELTTLSRKMVGVPQGESHLRRRRARPTFAAAAPRGQRTVAAMKCRLERDGSVSAITYFSN
jgi:hypothetical protein